MQNLYRVYRALTTYTINRVKATHLLNHESNVTFIQRKVGIFCSYILTRTSYLLTISDEMTCTRQTR